MLVYEPCSLSFDLKTFAVLDALSTEPSLATVNDRLAQEHDPEKLPEQVASALHIAFANNWVADVSVKDQKAGAN